MGLFDFGKSAPQAPNPIQTGALQTATNIGTGISGAYMNNVNQITPEGELRYDVTSNYDYKDPASGQVYSIPRFTVTQNPSPFNRTLSDLGNASKYNLAELAKDQSYYLWKNQNFDPLGGAPGAPTWENVPDAATSFADVAPQQMGLGNYGSQQYGFGDAGALTRDYGPADSFSADRSRVEESLYGRLNPQLDRERANLEQRLSDQGIRYGSQAYQDAMLDYSRQANDARLAVTQTAGQEQQRMMDMAAQRAGFQNAAQKQAYDQALGRGEFYNKAQAQQFQEQLQAGTFYNQAQKDAFQQAAMRGEFANSALAQRLANQQAEFNAGNLSRQQYLNEQYANRNQRFNEIASLMSGSQVTQPTWANTPNYNMATTDYAGLINNRFSQDLSIYQQQSANFNSLMGGIFGALGSIGKGYAMQSDRRVKDDIEKIGTVFASGPDDEGELPVYRYTYKQDPTDTPYTGPMAQDVERFDKGAVKEIGGVKHINLTRMGSILKAA